MADPLDPQLVRTLRRLGAIEPNAARAQRAIAQAHARLQAEAGNAARQSTGWQLLPWRQFPWREGVGGRWPVVSAVGLVAALLLVWLIGDLSRSGVALADVVSALNSLQSIRYTTSVDTGQGLVVESRTLYKTRNLERIEYATGRVFVLDRTSGHSLTLLPGEHRAIVRSDGVARDDLFDVVDALENNQRFARVLPEKLIEGVRAVGFELKGHSYEHLVWVDVRSRLLVRWETELRADDGQLTRRVHADFVYNEPLDAALFDLTPPSGFRVEQQGVPELAPLVDDALQSPNLNVGEGIGPARFGMSRDEVLRIFGPPDEIDEKLQSYRYPSRGVDLSISRARLACGA